jgi:5-methylthioadenosine/S-adenosylhomocysteine deaminase
VETVILPSVPAHSRRIVRSLLVVILISFGGFRAASPRAQPVSWDPSRGMLLEGTVVTMNAARDVLPHGRVLVRGGRIAAVWDGPIPPEGVDLDGVARPPIGAHALIYPGLINLHDHPLNDALPLWEAPSSHVQAALGRPLGTEPYANRYQWSMDSPPELLRLVSAPRTVLTEPLALNLAAEVVKYGEVRMILGGTTATQGASPNPAYDTLLARNVDNRNFGRDRIDNYVPALASLTGTALTGVVNRMKSGELDAWIVHLAEGVQDGDRRPGDPASSRAEFADLKSKALLTDATVIVHGVGLEGSDFAEMAAARPARGDATGDGRGAKLVWSPLSNLLLYGKTAAVYDALAAGVLVTLGTDWSPSGSPNLLTELKVADRALRDDRLLGSRRSLVPMLSTDGRTGDERRNAELALDRLIVEMVTINAARAVRWDDQVGSIDAGKVADLLVISDPHLPATPNIPSSPYRSLIDATEANVSLVIVDGEPVAGDISGMQLLKPGDFEIVRSDAGCFEKAIDVTAPNVPKGTETLAQMSFMIARGLRAMGGDHPPDGGGPSPLTNTWSYLRLHSLAGAGLSDAQFLFGVLIPIFGTVDGKLNLEGMSVAPLFMADDDWRFATIGANVDPTTELLADPTPPYAPYRANFNQVTALGNPLAPAEFERRWYLERGSVPCFLNLGFPNRNVRPGMFGRMTTVQSVGQAGPRTVQLSLRYRSD